MPHSSHIFVGKTSTHIDTSHHSLITRLSKYWDCPWNILCLNNRLWCCTLMLALTGPMLTPLSLVGNVSNMLADISSHHPMLPCFGQQPTCHQYRDWESILVMCWHILRHNICEASAKLACRDRYLPMLSLASHNIARVVDKSCDASPTCRHVGSWYVRWGV